MTTKNPKCRLQRCYDQLWQKAFPRIQVGDVQLDPVLAQRTVDPRRGLTVITRPSPGVQKAIAAFLEGLRKLEPDQHFYHMSELHVTLLSLFTATAGSTPYLSRKEEYVDAVDAALRTPPPLHISFEGITASPGTVMIQGFVESEALNALRETSRHELRARGLQEGVDERYRLETAHMTVLRFCAPLRNCQGFAAALEFARNRYFGETVVKSFLLVQNDWYMSRGATRVLKRYRGIRERGRPAGRSPILRSNKTHRYKA